MEDEERHNIPNVLQGEVARLDVKFLVNLDPSFCSNNGTVHLVCKLGESSRPPIISLASSHRLEVNYPLEGANAVSITQLSCSSSSRRQEPPQRSSPAAQRSCRLP